MGDRYSASINIGGEVSRPQLIKILKAAEEDGAAYGDWGNDPIISKDLGNLDRFVADPWLCFFNGEAPYGHFSCIEAVCVGENIPYDLLMSGYYDAVPAVEFHRNGHCTNWLSDTDHTLLCPLEPVRAARKALRSGDIGLALTLLDDSVLPEITELPPFVIVKRKRSNKRK